MNHPGIYLSMVWLVTLVGGVLFIGKPIVETGDTMGFVCPPCGCSIHHENTVFDGPGNCTDCGMPLISASHKKIRPLETVLQAGSNLTLYYHKILFPACFLALFIGIAIFVRSKQETTILLFLTFFLGHVTYYFNSQLYGTPHAMHTSERWFFFPLTFILATSPALYLYVRNSREKEWVWSVKEWLHFIPAGLAVLTYSVFFFSTESWRDWALYNGFDHFPALAGQVTFIVGGIYYCLLIGRVMQSTDNEKQVTLWQKQLLIYQWVIISIWAIFILANAMFYHLMSTSLEYHPVWFLVGLFTLWCSHFLVFKKEIVFPNGQRKETRLATPALENWKEKLELEMRTHKLYLNPNLSLHILAESIGIKEKDLSEVLNMGFAKSFYDYVNEYRIEEVKKMLLDPGKNHLTNIAIAQEAGFKSKSAFFGLFKKYVGMTPGEFKKQG